MAGTLATVSRHPEFPQRQVITIVLHSDVADLTCGRMLSPMEGPIEDDPGAHATAELDQDEIAVGGAAAELEQSRHRGIVGDRDGDVEPAPQLGAQIESMPVEVRGLEDCAFGVDHTGSTDSDAENRGSGLRDQCLDQIDCHLVGFCTDRGGLRLICIDTLVNPPAQIHQCSPERPVT